MWDVSKGCGCPTCVRAWHCLGDSAGPSHPRAHRIAQKLEKLTKLQTLCVLTPQIGDAELKEMATLPSLKNLVLAEPPVNTWFREQEELTGHYQFFDLLRTGRLNTETDAQFVSLRGLLGCYYVVAKSYANDVRVELRVGGPDASVVSGDGPTWAAHHPFV